MAAQLAYLSDRALSKLREDVTRNLARYRGGGFGDLADDPTWDIRLGIEYDAELLDRLDVRQPRAIATIDLENSKVVGRALSQLTPALASEERIWVRLAHIEAFEYSRARWLESESDERLPQAVHTHMFAATQTGIRDDHSLSRLWWNYQIAFTCFPEDVDSALGLILKTADIRSNFVERIWMTSRPRLAASVLKTMQFDSWVTSTEGNFRRFMKVLNKLGGGIVFEALSDAEVDAFIVECVAYAKASGPSRAA